MYEFHNLKTRAEILNNLRNVKKVIEKRSFIENRDEFYYLAKGQAKALLWMLGMTEKEYTIYKEKTKRPSSTLQFGNSK